MSGTPGTLKTLTGIGDSLLWHLSYTIRVTSGLLHNTRQLWCQMVKHHMMNTYGDAINKLHTPASVHLKRLGQ